MEQFDRSCSADVVLPTSTAELLLRRAAERWGPAAVGRDVVTVWPPRPGADLRPTGAFVLRWGAPLDGETTICELAWDGSRASAEQVCRAINTLAGWPVARGAAPPVPAA